LKDLILHENSSFVLPTKITENEDISLSQAYITLFLTYIGSIDIDLTVGTTFQLGKSNVFNFRATLLKINSDIYTTMKDDYSLHSIVLENYSDDNDSVTFKVRLQKTDGTSTTTEISI